MQRFQLSLHTRMWLVKPYSVHLSGLLNDRTIVVHVPHGDLYVPSAVRSEDKEEQLQFPARFGNKSVT